MPQLLLASASSQLSPAAAAVVPPAAAAAGAHSSRRARCLPRQGGLRSPRSSSSSSSSRAAHTCHAAPPDADPGLSAFKALIGERRFFCTQCGKCCQGDGEVWVSDAECEAIAQHLGLPLKQFLKRHTHAYSRLEGWRLLRTQGNETSDCTFLLPDQTCAIHAVRPQQCSTYPWWPELMQPKEWEWEKANICEGFDHADAPPTDLDAAAQQLRLAVTQEYAKLLAAKKKPRAGSTPGSAGAPGMTAAAAAAAGLTDEAGVNAGAAALQGGAHQQPQATSAQQKRQRRQRRQPLDGT